MGVEYTEREKILLGMLNTCFDEFHSIMRNEGSGNSADKDRFTQGIALAKEALSNRAIRREKT